MQLFAGLDRTDYQDVLRALGRHLDEVGVRDLRLIEQETRLTVQYRLLHESAHDFQTLHLGDDELLGLLHRAYRAAGQGDAAAATPPWLGLTYQDLLRAVGRVLDDEGLRDLRLVEQPQGVLVQVAPAGQRRREYRTYRLGAGHLRLLARITAEQHQAGSFGPPVA